MRSYTPARRTVRRSRLTRRCSISLRGSFSTLSLPELLKVLGDTRKTGTLICSSARASKRIHLVDGVVESADSTDPNEMLGHFLISRGLATEEQVREALEIQERTKVFSGAALVALGALDAKTLQTALREKTEEVIYSLFEWQQGTFHFQPCDPPSGAKLVPLNLQVEEVLWRGAERQSEIARIRKVFPDANLVPRLLREPPGALLKKPLARRIYEATDGRRSFAEIQLAVHGSEYQVGRQLFELFSQGCLVVMEPERAAQVEEDPKRSLEQGDAMFREGRFEDALRVYRAALDAGSERPDLQKLVQGTERLLLDQIYRDELPRNAVLQKVWDTEQILVGGFTPEEYFLIDQVNARWNVTSLVRLSPLREVDGLLVLRDLVRRRVLKIVEPL